MTYHKPHIPDFRKVAKSLRAVARTTAVEHADEFAEDERIAFRSRVQAQQFDSFASVPLSEKWLARKRAAGADLRTMIATHHYLNQIKIQKRVNANGSTTVVVSHDTQTLARKLDGTPADILLAEVARVQEHGSANHVVPARPHWGPHFHGMHQRAVQRRKDVRADVAKRLQLLHPTMPKMKGV